MPSSGMLQGGGFARVETLEERIAYISRVTRIGKLGTTLAVTNYRRTLRRNTYHSDDGGDTFLGIVGSYKNHKALTSQKTAFFRYKFVSLQLSPS
jgi:hypothetical protein